MSRPIWPILTFRKFRPSGIKDTDICLPDDLIWVAEVQNLNTAHSKAMREKANSSPWICQDRYLEETLKKTNPISKIKTKPIRLFTPKEKTYKIPIVPDSRYVVKLFNDICKYSGLDLLKPSVEAICGALLCIRSYAAPVDLNNYYFTHTSTEWYVPVKTMAKWEETNLIQRLETQLINSVPSEAYQAAEVVLALGTK